MLEININNFWNPENRTMVTKWIAITLFMLVDASRKKEGSPTVDEVMAKLGISDEPLAAYLLAGTQKFFERYLNSVDRNVLSSESLSKQSPESARGGPVALKGGAVGSYL